MSLNIIGDVSLSCLLLSGIDDSIRPMVPADNLGLTPTTTHTIARVDVQLQVASRERPGKIIGWREVGLSNYEPDILAKGLDVVFCGINPAVSAAADGHNFSNRSNRFWPVLHLAGFTDMRLEPQNERRLLEYRCGITAVVRRPTAQAGEVSPEEFREARLSFETKMRHYAPRSIAFLGKRACSIMTHQPDVPWGRQPSTFVDTMAWILPNPSGRNRSFTLDALVKSYSDLRAALA